jgi:hypothetical protein
MLPDQPRAKRLHRKLADLLIDPPHVDADALHATVTTIHESGLFRSLRDFHGKPFNSFDGYCRAPRPFGLNLSQRRLERIVSDCIGRPRSPVEDCTNQKGHGDGTQCVGEKDDYPAHSTSP